MSSHDAPPPHPIGHSVAETLSKLVTRTAASLIRSDSQVTLQVDIDESEPPADASLIGLLVESLVRAAIAEMPAGGELFITGVQTEQGYELEIADEGHPVADRFQWRPLVAAKLGATLRWQDCPQGGAAVTIRFPADADRDASDRGGRVDQNEVVRVAA